jgi:hypothetical protein
MAGYSDTPLLHKLGYEEDDTVWAQNAPRWFLNDLLEAMVLPVEALPATWMHAFLTTSKELAALMERIDLENIEKGFWVSWPKKSSGLQTDINEQSFRDAILPLGWVDVKVCAIDDIWSGLKFVRRKN